MHIREKGAGRRMSYELRKIQITDVQFGDVNRIDKGVLTIDAQSIIDLLMEDKRIKSVEIDIAKPAESVRILPVKDVIEPRAKAEGNVFPGIQSDVAEAGKGVTYALKGCAVVTTGPIVGFQEGLIDMSGPGAQYSIFSKLNNIVIQIFKEENVEPHEHEQIVREAGIKAARYIGQIGLNYEDYVSEEIHWKPIGEKYREYPELPKVVYVYNCMAQGLLHDTYYYGRDAKMMIPTLITPPEVADGAIVSGNCVSPGSKTTTYHHQNNAVLEQCLARHGKEINFMGIVLNPLMVTLKEKTVKSSSRNKSRSRKKKSRQNHLRDESKNRVSISQRPPDLKEVDDAPAMDFLKDVISRMGLDLEVKAYANEECVYFEISGPDSGSIIGKRGQTLDSIQYLTSLVANKDRDKYLRVIVDAENYRSKREKTLEQLANRLADKVQRTGKNVRLEPMNPYERKVIHSALQKNAAVTTRSEGEEPYRRVIIERK
jgi:predicted RNA-binding protein Jag